MRTIFSFFKISAKTGWGKKIRIGCYIGIFCLVTLSIILFFHVRQQMSDSRFLRKIDATTLHYPDQIRGNEYLSKETVDWLADFLGVDWEGIRYTIASPYKITFPSDLSPSEAVRLNTIIQRISNLKSIKVRGQGVSSSDPREDGECCVVTKILTKLPPQVNTLYIDDGHPPSEPDNPYRMENFFTDQTMATLQEPLSHLDTLIILSNRTSDEGVKYLLPSSQLKTLFILGVHNNRPVITDASVNHISKIESLEWLALRNTQITGENLEQLESLKSLSRLNLSWNFIFPEHAKKLSKVASLQRLVISLKPSNNNQVDLSGLFELSQLKILQIANRTSEHIDKKQLADLKIMLSTCSISTDGRYSSPLYRFSEH